MLTVLFAARRGRDAEPGLGRLSACCSSASPSISPSSSRSVTARTVTRPAIRRAACGRPRGGPARRSWWPRWPPRPGSWPSSRPLSAASRELGLIAGGGMLIAFACTLTLPARRHHPVPARAASRPRSASPGPAGSMPVVTRSPRRCWRCSAHWPALALGARAAAAIRLPTRCTPRTRPPRRCARCAT